MIRGSSLFASASNSIGVLGWQVLIVLRVKEMKELCWLNVAHLFGDLLLSKLVCAVLRAVWNSDPKTEIKVVGTYALSFGLSDSSSVEGSSL